MHAPVLEQTTTETMNNLSILFLFVLPLLASCSKEQVGHSQVYIVYFGEHSGDKTFKEIEETHYSYLNSVKKPEEEARAALLYSYKHSINGFAAVLTPDEASKLSELEEVASVYESRDIKYSKQTTRSWEFVGLDVGEVEHNRSHHLRKGGNLLARAGYGKDVIIGVLDSGIWPESKSFSDEGMQPIPQSWKGICQTGTAFNSSHCNRKIIGARYYIAHYLQQYGYLNATEDYMSPRDMDGHGTHVASIAAGRKVPNAAAYGGFARGTASGGAPFARLAVYKACWAIPKQEKIVGNTCMGADMLAAIDDAIGDGVHVLSISIAGYEPYAFWDDGIAVGALHAVKQNIVVSCAAGNSGPTPSTVANTFPWLITVAATSVDRTFVGPVILGNGKQIQGQTLTPNKDDKMHPLVYASDVVGLHVPPNETSLCLPNSLSPEKVHGKIVFCLRDRTGLRFLKGTEVKRAGGAGFILGNGPGMLDELPLEPHVLPSTSVTYKDAMEIIKYIKSTKNPVASLGEARTVLHYRPAPYMAEFSSRGPSILDPTILKPDIAAPGVYILAAWSEVSPPTKVSADHRSVKYNIVAGTSMACPHVSATAALLRAIHPNWSSAAIKSAIMTTAWMKNNLDRPITDLYGNISTPFQFGSGQFRPAMAADPGLVYNASYTDYLLYLCSSGVKNADPNFVCPKVSPPTYNLNYPSVAIPKLSGTLIVKRTVTNVGAPKSVYLFTARPPWGISIEASPSILHFDHIGQKRDFNITVRARYPIKAKEYYKDEYAFGWYTWADGHHNVTSPIAVSLA